MDEKKYTWVELVQAFLSGISFSVGIWILFEVIKLTRQ